MRIVTLGISLVVAACSRTALPVGSFQERGAGGSGSSGSVSSAVSSSGAGGSGAGGAQCATDCSLCGGTCDGSRCTPQILAVDDTSGSFAGKIVVDDDYVYWGEINEPGAILRVPKSGGAPETLATSQGTFALARDDTFLYWARWWQGPVMKMPLDGSSAPIELAPGQPYGKDQPVGLAVDESTVYWSTYQGGAIWSVPKTGGPASQLAAAEHPGFVAVRDASLYWVEMSPKAAVVRMPLAGGPKTQLVVKPWSLGSLASADFAIAGDYAYWADGSFHEVLRVPLSGGPSTVITSGPSGYQPNFVAVDDENVYWTDFSQGFVAKASLAGGSATEVAFIPMSEPTGIAVDENCVYWAGSLVSNQKGAIWRVAK